jgi:hypothetical protein
MPKIFWTINRHLDHSSTFLRVFAMQHIWIIDKDTGTTLFYRNYADIKIDPDLVSGLLSALNNFSEVEMKQHGIESINMGGLKWCYVSDPEYNLLLITADSKEANSDMMRARLEVIKNMFIQMYNITSDGLKAGFVNVNQFTGFSSILDTLSMQWEQAEKTMGTAELFDLLGIFQQIFSGANSIIHNNVFGEKFEHLSEDIKQFVSELHETPEMQESEELQNITYDDQQGWTILTLNPMKLDETNLKRTLFSITTNLKDVITKFLGNIIALNEFNKEIFTYVLSNWDLLEKLQISKNLFDLFLRRSITQRDNKNGPITESE